MPFLNVWKFFGWEVCKPFSTQLPRRSREWTRTSAVWFVLKVEHLDSSFTPRRAVTAKIIPAVSSLSNTNNPSVLETRYSQDGKYALTSLGRRSSGGIFLSNGRKKKHQTQSVLGLCWCSWDRFVNCGWWHWLGSEGSVKSSGVGLLSRLVQTNRIFRTAAYNCGLKVKKKSLVHLFVFGRLQIWFFFLKSNVYIRILLMNSKALFWFLLSFHTNTKTLLKNTIIFHTYWWTEIHEKMSC